MFERIGVNRLMPHGKTFSALVEFQIDQLKGMEHSLEIALNEERKRLESFKEELKPEKYDSEYEYHSHLDSLYDDFSQTVEIEKILKILIVVKLYMVVEITTKHIMAWTVKDLPDKEKDDLLREMSYWNKLKKKLKKEFSLKLASVSEYIVINELRCLSNVIKHGGFVDKYLSQFPIWRNDRGEEIDTNKIDLKKFYSSVPKYIYDLVEKINNKLILKESDKKKGSGSNF